MFLLAVSAALALHTTIVQPPAPAADVSLGAPAPVAELDTGKLKGIPERLAWSPDGSELYVQAVERDKSFNVKSTKHYVISTAAKDMRTVDQEPEWASKYWTWKSAQYSPAAAAFMIATPVPQQETVRATAAPMGGDLARGGTAATGTTNADAASAAAMTQIQTVYALKIKGETIGEWINEPVTPGSNYTWAPKPIRLFAYARRGGGPLVVLDESGRKQELKGAEAAILPAWSDDGGRLAWLERSGKKKYALMVAPVTVSR